MIAPSIIEPLSNIWWTGIIMSISFIFIILQLGTRIPPDKRKILMVALGLVLILVEFFQQIYLYRLGIWKLESSLPIHLCGISGIIRSENGVTGLVADDLRFTLYLNNLKPITFLHSIP